MSQLIMRIMTGLANMMLFTAWPTIAAEVQPFALYNQSPVLQVYGLPLPGGFRVLPEGAQTVTLTLDLTNNFIGRTKPGESLIFDGETHRGTLIYRRGLGNNLDLSFELPFVRHDGGFMDGFIDDFHGVFGFGSGGRDRVAEDQLLYRVVRGGNTPVNVDDSTGGVGDLRFSLSRELTNMPQGRGASVGATLKLPAGDADRLTGSGAADLAVWATYGTDNPDSRWGLVGTIGAIHTGKGEILRDLRRQGGLFGSLTLAYAWSETLQFKTQVYANSALYKDSALDPLNSTSILGVLGGSWQFSPLWGLDVGVVEDLHAGASPDVSFHFALRRRI